jgi:hypothetical protein
MVPVLSENHKRRLQVAFKHADHLLSQSLEAAEPHHSGLYPRYVEDISASTLHHLESHAELIRQQMRDLMERLDIEVQVPSKASSWVVRTNLASLDIGFEDLFPEKLRGYGEMDEASAQDLTHTLHEMRRIISRLSSFFAESKESCKEQKEE